MYKQGLLFLLATLSIGSSAQSIVPKSDPKKGTWGYVDQSGNWVVKPKYTQADQMKTLPNGVNAALVADKQKIGYIGPDGKPIGAGIVFTSIDSISPNAAIVNLGDKYGMVDWAMNYIVKPEFISIRPITSSLFLLDKKGKYGVADLNGKTLLPSEYAAIEYQDPGYLIYTSGNKKGLYSVAGQTTLLQPEYAEVMLPIEISGASLIPVKDSKNRWGLVNKNGSILLPNKYTSISPLSELNALLLQLPNNSQEAYFPEENTIIPIALDELRNVGPFSILTARLSKQSDPKALRLYSSLSKDGKITRVVGPGGELVSDWTTPSVVSYGDKYLVATGATTSSLFDQEGKLIASGLKGSPKDDNGWTLFDDIALSPDGKSYHYKKIGELAVMTESLSQPQWRIFSKGQLSENSYDEVTGFLEFMLENYYETKKDGKYGLLKGDKEILAPVSYDHPGLNYDYVIKYQTAPDSGYGILSLDGNKLIEDSKEDIIMVAGNYGLYPGETGKSLFFIPETNDKIVELTPRIYDNISLISDTELFWVLKNNLYGVIDTSGNTIVPVNYKAENLNWNSDADLFIAKQGAKTVYYNTDGTINPAKREVIVNSQWLEHNVYDKRNNKSLKINFNFETHFLNNDNEEVYVEALFYKKNGQPALNSKGQQIKWGYWVRPAYFNSLYSDQGVTFPYTLFVQGKGRQDYYVVLRFQDEYNRILPTTGNNKMDFYLTRN